MTVVVDASVVVEFLAPGPEARAADRVMGALGWPEPITLVAPDLLFLEAANALRKLAVRGGISQDGADRAVAALGQLPIAAVRCSALLDGAWSLRANFTVYDAAYLALARDLGLPYVTSDARAARAAGVAGITAWHVGDEDLRRLLDALESASPA